MDPLRAFCPVSITPNQMRAARRLLAWSQDHLAGLLGVSDATISAFERGTRPSALDAALARALFERSGVAFVDSDEAAIWAERRDPKG